jgi:hypothetical protein
VVRIGDEEGCRRHEESYVWGGCGMVHRVHCRSRRHTALLWRLDLLSVVTDNYFHFIPHFRMLVEK